MDKLDRIDSIKHLLLAIGGKVVGRKKLHKLAYLCQEAGTDLGQSFTFHYYGVYSPSLADDLVTADEWKEISEEYNEPSYVIKLALESERVKTNSFIDGLKVVSDLAEEEPAVLEVLSTIVYLDRHGFEEKDLHRKLEALKGHLKRCFKRALQLASERYDIAV